MSVVMFDRFAGEESMVTKVVSVAAGVALMIAIAVTPARAHHSFAAEFDAKRPVKLRGTVVKMEWINPHSWIHIDVKDPQTGKVERWMIEGGAPNALLRRGWTKNSLPEGTRNPWSSKDSRPRHGANRANGRDITFPGLARKLFVFGSSGHRRARTRTTGVIVRALNSACGPLRPDRSRSTSYRASAVDSSF
jgi:hypothetical protein